MKHIVQFSGGAGSFAAAKWVVETFGAENTVLLFADTMMEDEDLYRFLDQTSEFLGVPLTRLADGRNPWQVFWDKRFLGNSQVDPCSRILKRELCKNWVKKNFPDTSSCRLYVGIDWTEAHRVKNVCNWWSPYEVYCPLVDALPNFDKNAFMEEMQGWGIALPRLYAMGFPHNNCGGFCIKAGKAHFLNLLEKMPERYAYHEEQERKLGAHLQKEGKPAYTILREDVKKVRRYISLQELRERQEDIRKTEDGQYEWGGCGCFADIPADEMEVAAI